MLRRIVLIFWLFRSSLWGLLSSLPFIRRLVTMSFLPTLRLAMSGEGFGMKNVSAWAELMPTL